METTINEANKDRFSGLSHAENSLTESDKYFAVRAYSNGVSYCYEPSTNGAFGGYYGPGDKLRIAVESGVVKSYLISGTNDDFAVQGNAFAYLPFPADAALHHNGATVTNAIISGKRNASAPTARK